jgi:hypothetical protein
VALESIFEALETIFWARRNFFGSPDFFFSLVGSPERPLRVAGSLPLAVGVDRGHPQWPDLFFFFLFAGKVAGGGRRMAVDGGVRRRRWVVGFLFGGLIC